MEKFKGLVPKVIGHVGVDAGIVWIGDPCYVFHKDDDEKPKSIGRNWGEFCMKLGESDYNARSFEYDLGHEGLGVCTPTYSGDGYYPVVGFFAADDPKFRRPLAVMVDFCNLTDGDEQNEEQ